MSAGDFFDISTARVLNPETLERPSWPSKDAHLKNSPPSDDVDFLPALPTCQAKFRHKLSPKLAKAVEEFEKSTSMSLEARAPEPQDGEKLLNGVESPANSESNSGSAASSEYQSVGEDDAQNVQFVMSNWDPMAEDYSNKVFNSCQEPEMSELLKSMPTSNNGEEYQRQESESVYDTVRTEQGDIRLHVSNIPCQLTQEGLRNLFSQAGKVIFCKVYSHRHPNKQTNFGFVGFQKISEATTAIQNFDGFVFEHEQVRLRVSLAKPKLNRKDVYSDRESTDELTRDAVTVQNGIGREAADSNSDQRSCDQGSVSQNTKEVNARVPFGVGAGRGRAPSNSIVHQALGHVNTDLSTAVSSINSIPGPARKSRPCKVCSRSTTKTCSVCKVPYCSVGCQKQDWSEHKRACKKSSQQNEQVALEKGNTEVPSPTVSADHSSLKDSSSVSPSYCSSPQDVAQPIASSETKQSLEIDEENLKLENIEGFAQMFGFPTSHGMVLSSGHSTSSLTSADESFYNTENSTLNVKRPDVTGECMSQAQRQPVENVPDVTQPDNSASQQHYQVEDTPDVTSQIVSEPEMSNHAENLPDITSIGEPVQPKPAHCYTNSVETGTKITATTDIPPVFHILGTTLVDERSFWGQIVNESTASELYNMINELTQHSLVPLAYDKQLLHVGSLCTLQFMSEYYRARIIQIHEDDTVDITYIDYGNSEKRALSDLFQLPAKFHHLPSQARLFVLHGIRDLSSVDIKKAQQEFLQPLIVDKTLIAERKGFSSDGNIEVVVTCSDSQDGLSVNAQIKSLFKSDIAVEYPTPDTVEAEIVPRRDAVIIKSPNILTKKTEADEGAVEKSHSPRTVASQLPAMLNHQVDQPGSLNCNQILQHSESQSSAQKFISEQNQNAKDTSSEPVEKSPRTNKVSHKIFHIKNVPYEKVPDGVFSVVVTHIMRPSLFWVQIRDDGLDTARSILSNDLNAVYSSSICENHVPGNGMVCVAQFSGDGNWYRATVDCVQNDGTLRVTFFDFGNSEDLAVDRIRRIEGRFVSLPRQAIKCCLHDVTSPSGITEWSEEAIDWFKDKVFNKECKMQVFGTHGEIHFVEMCDGFEGREKTLTINSELIAAGHGLTRSPSRQQNENSDSAKGQPGARRSKPGYGASQEHARERPLHSRSSSTSSASSGLSDQQKLEFKKKSPRMAQTDAGNPVARPKQYGTKNSLTSSLRGERDQARLENFKSPKIESFEVFVSEVISPWEFYSQKTNPQIISRLDQLNWDLNHYCTKAPVSNDLLSIGSSCCVKFSVDNLWYRGVVLENLGQTCRVRQVDFGNSEILPWSSVRPLPPQFLSLEPVSFRCSLANIKKPRQARDWDEKAKTYFKSLVLCRRVQCRPIRSRTDSQLVELTLMDSSEEVSVASKMIAAGLANEFLPVPKDEKLAPAFAGDHKVSQSKQDLNAFDSLIIEPAIAAAVLPSDKEPFLLMVTDISSVQKFCAQLLTQENANKLKELSDQMKTHYDVTSYPHVYPEELQFYAATFSDDGEWYRCIVQRTNKDGSLLVYYVDYGNSETVNATELRPLEKRFLQPPFFGLHCSLAGISPIDNTGFSKEATEFFKSKVECFAPVTAKLLSRKRNCLVVDIQTSEKKFVNQMLIEQGLAKRFKKDSHTVGDAASKSRQPEQSPQTVARQSQGRFEIKQKSQYGPLKDANHGARMENVASVKGKTIHDGPFASGSKIPGDAQAAPVSQQHSDSIEQANQVRQQHSAKNAQTNPVIQQSFGGNSQAYSVSQQNFGRNAQATSVNQHDSSIVAGMGQAASAQIQSSSGGDRIIPELSQPDKNRKPLVVSHTEPRPPVKTASEGSVNSTKFLEKERSTDLMEQPDLHAPNSGGIEELIFAPSISSLQLPPVGETFTAIVTDCSSPDLFCIQLATQENLEQLQQLSLSLNDYYSKTGYPPVNPQESCLYAAQFTQDNEWYRVHVVTLIPDDHVEVYYVDYGNREIFPCSRLRPLLPKFATSKFFGVQCSLGGVVPVDGKLWSEGACDLFQKNVPLFQLLKMTLVAKQHTRLVVDVLSVDNTMISEKLVRKGLAKIEAHFESEQHREEPSGDAELQLREQQPQRRSSQVLVPSNPTQLQEPAPPQASGLPLVPIPASEYFPVLVTEIRGPDHFYVQILSEDNANSLAALSEDLNKHCTSVAPEQQLPRVGELCCGHFSVDGSWNRAAVNNITESGKVEVTFVDYGNDETLTLPCIRRILPQFLVLPRQAVKCSLSGLKYPLVGNWPATTIDCLKRRILDQAFFARVEESSDCGITVELFDMSDSDPRPSISQELLTKGLAQSDTSSLPPAIIPQEDEFDAIVTEVQGSLRVWLQKIDREVLTAFNTLRGDLQEYCNTEAQMMDVAPFPGQSCCAQFSGDRSWYRARVATCNEVDSVTVQFVDYGNSEVLSLNNLKKINSQFLEIPCQAVECYLAGLKPVDTEKAEEWLRFIVDRPMRVKVLKREDKRIGIDLTDYNLPDGQRPVTISSEMINQGLALKV